MMVVRAAPRACLTLANLKAVPDCAPAVNCPVRQEAVYDRARLRLYGQS